MARMTGIRRLLRITRNRAGIDRAVDDELRFHFEMTMRELMANGMTPDEARKETERRFGDVQRTRERLATIDRARAGQEQRAEWSSAFAQDVRYALRGMRLKPAFAIAVIATLGLGIGANATMFGIVDRLLFRPPNGLIAPERAGRLYLLNTYRGKEEVSSGFGYRRYLDMKEMTTSFDAMTPFYQRQIAVGTGDATKIMSVAVSDPDLWKMFDVKPVFGRFFDKTDDDPEKPQNVLVVSYAFWQTQYGGRQDALGSTLQIGAKTYTVIGVAPDGFNGFGRVPSIGFLPISATMESGGRLPWYKTYNMTWFDVFARRKPGVSLQTANTDLTHAHEASYKIQWETSPKNTPPALMRPKGFLGPVLLDRGPNVGNDAKVATWLGGVAVIVLLIACANVANLLLARALRRKREIAVRLALGVSRGRLLMQLATESFLLAVFGGVAGLAVAQWGGAVMRTALFDRNAPAAVATVADSRVIAFAAVLTLVAGLLTGLAPAMQTRRTDISGTLKAGAREGTVHRSKLRIGLLVMQAALSVVLLVGAGLFMRSLYNVKNVRMGYDVERLLYVDANMRGVTLDSVQTIALLDGLVARAKTVPGVQNSARALTVPYWSTWSVDLYTAGIDSVNKLGDFTLQAGSPELLATMGTRVLRGRGITAEDREHAPRVMVVNEAMAKKLWPGQDPIGKCVRVNADTMPCSAVVGVAEDIHRGKLDEPELHYYLSLDQVWRKDGGVFVRTVGSAETNTEAVRRALQPLMPGASYVTVTPMATVMAPTIRSWKLGATMFAVFGGLALVLAAIGLYSVIAYNVAQRMHEMGVRVALGAQGHDVVALILREGLTIVLPGVALGAVIALLAGKWVEPLLFHVSPKDPPVLTGVVATLVVVAVSASWVPARRAARVDPNEALRSD